LKIIHQNEDVYLLNGGVDYIPVLKLKQGCVGLRAANGNVRFILMRLRAANGNVRFILMRLRAANGNVRFRYNVWSRLWI
jgi:hypothetical protein